MGLQSNCVDAGNDVIMFCSGGTVGSCGAVQPPTCVRCPVDVVRVMTSALLHVVRALVAAARAREESRLGCRHSPLSHSCGCCARLEEAHLAFRKHAFAMRPLIKVALAT